MGASFLPDPCRASFLPVLVEGQEARALEYRDGAVEQLPDSGSATFAPLLGICQHLLYRRINGQTKDLGLPWFLLWAQYGIEYSLLSLL